jgi:hypothetical protein
MHTKFWLRSVKETQLGRPSHRWKDTILMNLREIGFKGMD